MRPETATLVRYIGRRVATGLLVVIGVVVLTFVISRVIPSDPAATWVGGHVPAEVLEQARQDLGFDRPLRVQLWDYLRGVAIGDWGVSLRTRRPVLTDIAAGLPASIELVGTALLLGLMVGIPLGLISARYKGRVPDVLVRLVSVIGVSMPVFWLAPILQLVFFEKLELLPVAGRYDPALYYTSRLVSYTGMTVLDALIGLNGPVLRSSLVHLVIPALVLAAYPMGVVARMVRASALETLGDTHIQMVRALGFSEAAVFGRFALKPALNPVITVTALIFAYSLANTFLVEAIFNWPGLGLYAALAVQSLDTPAIVGITLVVALAYVLGNLAVDLLQTVIDPRIRLQ